MSLSTSQRLDLFNKYGGRCAYCGHMLPERGWHADHLEPVMRDSKIVRVNEPGRTHKYVQTGVLLRPENERLENYMPACRACNIDKACFPLEDWRRQLERRPQVLRDNHSAYRHAERFGLVKQVETRVIFYFETLAVREQEGKQ